jgi:hypothetical protein
MSQVGPKSCLFNVVGVDPDLPISGSEVQFAEVLRSAEVVEAFIYAG